MKELFKEIMEGIAMFLFVASIEAIVFAVFTLAIGVLFKIY